MSNIKSYNKTSIVLGTLLILLLSLCLFSLYKINTFSSEYDCSLKNIDCTIISSNDKLIKLKIINFGKDLNTFHLEIPNHKGISATYSLKIRESVELTISGNYPKHFSSPIEMHFNDGKIQKGGYIKI